MVSESEVDVDALRAKYSQPGYREQLVKEGLGSGTGGSTVELSKIRICQRCQATGYVQREYNYRVLQEQCPDCGGEGLLGTNQPSDEITRDAARRQRITQLEAAIASADTIEELDKLETELKSLDPTR
mmetsp:Transcript_13015/g.33919  ORF Transcript_13015/g.33919 Transcript_13015/m.33919 type:complete len:128 (+) Transcript_13015:118-501(+)